MDGLHDGTLLRDLQVSEQGQAMAWADRYRPKALWQIALDPQVREQFEVVLGSGNLTHHLVLAGPPGTGKTSAADVIANTLFPQRQRDHVLRVSAAQTGSVDFIREQVVGWMRSRGGLLRVLGKGWQGLIIFSEADGLTKEAQDVLKDALEIYASTTRVIFTTNNPDHLCDAIKSRCMLIEMDAPPENERVRFLSEVMSAEGFQADQGAVEAFASLHEDMRAMLNAAQVSLLKHGELRLPSLEGDWGDFWPVQVDGGGLLDRLTNAFLRFVSLPDGGAFAAALWVLFTHCHEAFGYSPILAAVSPVKRSGKTRLFEVLSQVTPRALLASNTTPASIFRLGGLVDEMTVGTRHYGPPRLTLLADEADTWFRLRPELQSVINSGHTRRLAFVLRIVGEEARRFSTWYPKGMALIERDTTELPPTVADRSIMIPMRRRRWDEPLALLRGDEENEELRDLRRQAARWARDHFLALCGANPIMPARIDDRTKDNWRPLMAIAEAIGPAWLDVAHQTCLSLCGALDENGEHTVLLLGDIREVFTNDGEQADRLPTSVLLARLCAIDDHPWPGWLTAHRLSQMLRPFRIGPKALWSGLDGVRKRTLRGYFLRDFRDAFDRYLPKKTE